MSNSNRYVVFCVLLAGVCFISWKRSLIGVKDALMLSGRGLILLAVCTLMIYMIQRLKSFFSPVCQEPSASPLHESSRLKQEQARINQQNKHNEKTSDYVEAVIKPRQNLFLQQKMERYHRMTGETWKLSQGFTVGEDESETHDDVDVNETPYQRAKRRRRLQTAAQVTVQQDVPKEKTVIVLPDEPQPDAEGVVKIALRCPSGRTIHRRFLKTWSSLLLLDWIKKSGYPPALYTLCTSYPRKPLLTAADVSLEDAGILVDTVLNVEEKDPSTT
ncbi:UBX domain-containing protein 8 [Triplophysa rosa]|uniref:UBX domain-containing protein 8 n=1 Tax=Triplophysa rosa TaxID=992332 RepID=A0A9W7T9Q7_TRIRA|nr:UBX domain-containing protein 8 [Triplophysa rosa]KAI7793235.1 UBX domain-containing protein 8 [Triplophysa rosa]